jgi:hypothetical protein
MKEIKMPLFTSSSENSVKDFFVRLAFAFVVLVVLYWGFITYFKPQSTIFQGQLQSNYVTAQKLIYAEKIPPVVIAGSSLSYRFEHQMLPENTFNLSFGGGSPLTGMSILEKTKFMPKLVLIETNVAFRPIDNAFIDRIFHPILEPLKRHILICRDEYQPSVLILNVLKNNFYKKSSLKKIYESSNPKMVKEIVRVALETESKPLRQDEIANIALLAEKVKKMKAQGVHVVLFEMPVHPQLANTIPAQQTRHWIKQYLPDVPVVQPDDLNRYETKDGSHLTPQSAERYLHYLLQKANSVTAL